MKSIWSAPLRFACLRFYVTFCGVGLLPKAPGTFGTLAAIPLAFAMGFWLSANAYLLLTSVVIFLSIFICELYERNSKEHDSGHIVIDEVVGYLVSFVWLPVTWQSALAAFILFRFFDIIKPYPISVLDRKVQGGLGVMIDDIAAGFITNIILQAVARQTSFLTS